ncbi:prolyl-trna synthetase [Colletotrichum karsti]|uniref:Prolyl-trna synthetase n=1 Tax=Colletotrichum karsti TaxID=1095194 RepID=A0A9P6HSA5_9PEZI|nr:prolyl-trna synthetase [Colletotrichum karsti]KAF9869433.1 prolyl-trna synthetase [Colletotrichum karsti]
MKDLYTFDVSPEAALETYNQVQAAYKGVFNALKLPVIVAKASSGDMGGDISHEYHLPTPVGEDTVITCDACDYTANTEIAETRAGTTEHITTANTEVSAAKVWRGISKDHATLVNVWYPGELLGELGVEEMHDVDVSIPAVKAVIPDLDASIDDAMSLWEKAVAPESMSGERMKRRPTLINLVDFRLASKKDELLHQQGRLWPLLQSATVMPEIDIITVAKGSDGQGLNVLAARSGDRCPSCDGGILKTRKALEVGHTFHLGTRYSEPLGATVSIPAGLDSGSDSDVQAVAERASAMQMGCHGIGVSRLIGAVVEHLADEKGLQWPRAIAPYETVIVPATDLAEEAARAYDEITNPADGSVGIDAVLDDRKVSFPWKLKDADLVGYPVVVVLGKVWKQTGNCEIQCRRLGIKETVPLAGLRQRVSQLLEQL